MAEIWQKSWICPGIIGIKQFSRVQVRFLMLNTMCLASLHNIQQDLINFIPVFSSLLMQMIFFLLLKQTVPNFDTRNFRASVIYIYTNPMIMYELMRIRTVAMLYDHNSHTEQTDHLVCLFVWFDLLCPINNLSVKQGRVFLCWTSTKLG